MNAKLELLDALLEPHLSLSREELAVLAPHLHAKRFAAGQPLFRMDQVCRHLVILADGVVRGYYLHEAREINLRLLCAPAVATAMSSLITGEPSRECVEAVTDVDGYRVDFDALRGQPLLAETLRRVLAEQHYLALERRLHMLQSKSVAEKYAFFCREMPRDIVERTPGYQIASYLAVTPETLSRVRKRIDVD